MEQPPLLISAAALRTRGGIPITAVDESERRFDASLIRKRRFFVDLLVACLWNHTSSSSSVDRGCGLLSSETS